jgi:Ser/Thr protein kinase RdoA (MazF antagonist)
VGQTNKAFADFPPRRILRAYSLDASAVRPIESGWINRTWLVDNPNAAKFVLQAVNPLFQAGTQLDIDDVTRHLEQQGMLTPRLVPDAEGRLFQTLDGGIWRLLTYIDGRTYERFTDIRQALEAGRILAEFHGALRSFSGELRGRRANVHALDRHLDALEAALEQQRHHAEFDEIARLADEVRDTCRRLHQVGEHPPRVVHGDPKLSNILFAPDSPRALCLIDLDTLTRMSAVLELGDAFRSWCNVKGEDDPDARFSFDYFRAAVTGYAQTAQGLLSATEWQAIPPGIATIAVELAARFCADALNESYFHWDAGRFVSATRHNQARTRAQLNIASDVLTHQQQLVDIVAEAFRNDG